LFCPKEESTIADATNKEVKIAFINHFFSQELQIEKCAMEHGLSGY